MSKLKEEELLNHLADLYTLYFAILFDPRPEVQEFLIDDNQPERQKYIDELEKGKKQAYQQIKEMIQKPIVDEEFVWKMVEESVYILHQDKHVFFKRKLKEAGVEIVGNEK